MTLEELEEQHLRNAYAFCQQLSGEEVGMAPFILMFQIYTTEKVIEMKHKLSLNIYTYLTKCGVKMPPFPPTIQEVMKKKE